MKWLTENPWARFFWQVLVNTVLAALFTVAITLLVRVVTLALGYHWTEAGAFSGAVGTIVGLAALLGSAGSVVIKTLAALANGDRF